MAEFSLCLSGGGYRAAMFHLGTLTYLNHVVLPIGGRLLDHVHSISCISGGAIPGILYSLCEANEEDRETCFKDIYKKLTENNIGELLVKRYNKESQKNTALINVLADIYDEIFFKGLKYSSILESMDWRKIHHLAIDSTDFDLGIPFRFQSTCELNIPNRKQPYGVIGNHRHIIEREDAANIRLADIMASTSCFPLVFEPIVYPDDFKFSSGEGPIYAENESISLMDGGLVDNQGIDPITHACKHLSDVSKDMDLIIVSDAGNITKGSSTSTLRFPELSPNFYFWAFYATGLFMGIGAVFCWKKELFLFMGLLLGLFLFFIAFAIIIKKIVDYIIARIKERVNLDADYEFIWSSSINNIIEFIRARTATAVKMVDVIMMGHIKKVALKGLLTSTYYYHKIVRSPLSELYSKKWVDSFEKRNYLDREMKPSRRISINSAVANGMGTTLWFTQEDIKQNVPQALLASGQYTICWCLLQHIDRLSTCSPEELTEGQRLLLTLKPLLKGDWNRFNQNPKVLTHNYTD